MVEAHLRGRRGRGRWGLLEMGGLFKKGRGLFDLEKKMVSVLHKELGYKVDKLMYKKVGGHATKTNPNFQFINKPSRICPHEVKKS